MRGAVAEWLRHKTHNQEVMGSIPASAEYSIEKFKKRNYVRQMGHTKNTLKLKPEWKKAIEDQWQINSSIYSSFWIANF